MYKILQMIQNYSRTSQMKDINQKYQEKFVPDHILCMFLKSHLYLLQKRHTFWQKNYHNDINPQLFHKIESH